ncbi:MAG: hypothetical protein GX748_11905 [Lentisphaerae bacterium]|nr:hypothetical protein [Lentisphaerota bacterium]
MRIIKYMILFVTCLTALGWAGCTSTQLIENTRVPEITLLESGEVIFDNRTVDVSKLASRLHRKGIRADQEVNILIPDHADRKTMRVISAELLRGGYSRTVFVTHRKASSTLQNPKKKY